jgi:hypothetical protein
VLRERGLGNKTWCPPRRISTRSPAGWCCWWSGSIRCADDYQCRLSFDQQCRMPTEVANLTKRWMALLWTGS